MTADDCITLIEQMSEEWRPNYPSKLTANAIINRIRREQERRAKSELPNPVADSPPGGEFQ